jgi:hypothetical protein
VIRQLDQELVKWARQKYKKLRNRVQRARCWVSRTSAALTEAKEIVTTLSRSFQERQVEKALFARQV